MMVSRLAEGRIWNPFSFFNKNDSGFTERMNNNTELLSSCKIPPKLQVC